MASTVQPPINQALASLKDIQLPEPVGIWPLAPGYWILMIIAVVLVILGIFLYRRTKINTAVKKATLLELSQLSLVDKDFSQTVNTLLKRAVLSYLPRNQVAALDGDNWYLLLDSQLPDNKKGQFKLLLDNRFSQQKFSQQDAEKLKVLAENWIKKALPLDIGNTKVQEALC